MNNSIPNSTKLPPESLNEDTQDDELPTADQDEQHKPPVRLGPNREAGDSATEADPQTGRADEKGHIPPPQFSNRK